MTVFNPGGTSISVGSAGTVTLNGVGDVIKVTPLAPASGGRVNGVACTAQESMFIAIPLDATTVEVELSPCRIIRGTAR